MPDEINYNDVRQGIEETTTASEALRALLRGVLSEAVSAVANGLHHGNIDPTTMPAQYFIQAALVEAEKIFVPFTGQESWNAVYSTYVRVNQIMEASPELRALRERRLSQNQPPEASEVDAFLKEVFGEDK